MLRDKIKTKLNEIETMHNVKILYACESGSRAWGFESKNSDYDVRFIYKRNLSWYLKVDSQRDVIELPIDDELDINGWDIKKALHLLKKSNPALIEWIHSPIIYKKDEGFYDEFKALSKEFYKPKACFYHYSSMASKNFRGYLQTDEVRVKKYFYVIRPLLALRWIEQDFGIVPVEFEKLLITIKDDKLLKIISKLLAEKRAGFESKYIKKIEPLNEFIERELKRHEISNREFKNSYRDLGKLDEFLYKSVVGV